MASVRLLEMLSGVVSIFRNRPRGELGLGPDRMLVGALPCLCYSAQHPRVHRTWRCVACDACWVWPPCRKHPEWPIWAGVPPHDSSAIPF